MSADETDDTSEGQDEDGLLYGDVEPPQEKTSDSSTTVLASPKIDDNGLKTEKTGMNEGDSEREEDDDDGICVTIGDIKSGSSSQSTTLGSLAIHLKAEGRTQTVVSPKLQGVDLDSLGCIQGNPVFDVDVQSFEEKPWRKPGADISDYFNYGFAEDTWKAYCEKQKTMRMSHETMSSKLMRCTSQRDKDPLCDYGRSGSLHKSRRSYSTVDVIGGQTGSSSRMQGRRHHSNEETDIQVLSEASSDGDSSANKISSFFPPNIPPPPFLPPPSNVSPAPPLIPPLCFPLPPGVPPPPSLISVMDRGSNESPIPPYQYSPGAFPVLQTNTASWSGAVETAKAWEYISLWNREWERDKDRDRCREHGHDRGRGSRREREHSPSSQALSEEEWQRERGEQGYEHHSERSSQEREERHRDRRHRDKDEGRQKTTCSSGSRRRHDSERRGSSRHRHKHKKSKTSRKDQETCDEPS